MAHIPEINFSLCFTLGQWRACPAPSDHWTQKSDRWPVTEPEETKKDSDAVSEPESIQIRVILPIIFEFLNQTYLLIFKIIYMENIFLLINQRSI